MHYLQNVLRADRRRYCDWYTYCTTLEKNTVGLPSADPAETLFAGTIKKNMRRRRCCGSRHRRSGVCKISLLAREPFAYNFYTVSHTQLHTHVVHSITRTRNDSGRCAWCYYNRILRRYGFFCGYVITHDNIVVGGLTGGVRGPANVW